MVDNSRRRFVQVTGTALAGALAGCSGGDTSDGSDGSADAAERSADRTVTVWTVQTWSDAAVARSCDADGIIANYPGLLARDESSP